MHFSPFGETVFKFRYINLVSEIHKSTILFCENVLFIMKIINIKKIFCFLKT